MSMSAFAEPMVKEPLQFQPMRIADVDAIVGIEQEAYPFPWSRGNFVDSLASGYRCRVLRDGYDGLVGYFLIMMAVDEAHLLNITVAPSFHGRGLGRMLLDHAVAVALEESAVSMLLEVRPSNPRAIRIYERYGFSRIGIRKNYYPAANNMREDAIVMRKPL